MDRNQGGFTLIELIISATIFGLFVIGITNLYMTIQLTQRKTYRLEVATRAGEKQIESLRNINYGSLTPGSTIDFTSSLPPDLPSPRSGLVQISEPESDIRRVDITISYRDGPTERVVKQSSLIGVLGITE